MSEACKPPAGVLITAFGQQVCQLLAFGQLELAALLDKAPRAYIGLLLAAGLALAPVIRRFISLGLNRVWLNSGDTIYRQANAVCRDGPVWNLLLMHSYAAGHAPLWSSARNGLQHCVKRPSIQS